MALRESSPLRADRATGNPKAGAEPAKKPQVKHRAPASKASERPWAQFRAGRAARDDF